MAKESGLGALYMVDGVDVSGDTREFGTIDKRMATFEMPGIDVEAMVRQAGQLDGEMSWTSYFNPTNAHELYEDLPRTDRVMSYFHRRTLGTPTANIVGKQMNYDGDRAQDGMLTLKIQGLANAYWLDWGKSLTAGKRTDTAATNGTGVDFGAAGSFGLQAYLHVEAFTGTSVTVKLQQSSDNGVGDAWADVTGGGFTVVSAGGISERIQTARNQAVERYLRAVTTGTFSNAIFTVGATVNRTNLTI